MPAKPFPFITDGIHGDVPTNFYPASDSERHVLLQPTPGLDAICTLASCTEIRGLYAWGGFLYAVARRGTTSVVFRVSSSGANAEVGSFTTSYTGPVWMVNNPTQLCIVDGLWGYVYTPATNHFDIITDPAFPGASSVDYQDGYGLFTTPNSNQWFFSTLYDFSSFDALDFYNKTSSPDNIIGILSHKREPHVLGQQTTEVWYNYGGDNSSVSNPTFAINAGGVITYGLGASKSANTVDGTAPHWLTDKGQVVMSGGYQAKVMSNQVMDREIMTYSTFADAIAFGYREGGHTFYHLSFPAASKTWVLDLTTKLWHRRSSYLDDGSGFGRHRANCYALLNNKHYVGDYSNGKIYQMSPDFYDDDGNAIQRIAYTREMDGGLSRTFFPPLQLIVESGVGVPQITRDAQNAITAGDPQIMMQMSGDGGNTWGSELWAAAGKIGEYRRQARWNRVGSDYKRMYRFMMTDAVLWRILGIDGVG